ncbi:MAG: A/G-specific adenine glycosylase [Alphaproteobacteria bacterium]
MDATQFSTDLLAWYDRHRRRLPWRALPEEQADPYRIWLSEIMLQQTTVAAAGPYFMRFCELWPRVQDLAAAPLDKVLTEWAGLGYYARARNLHKCAIHVTEELGGRFPRSEAELLKLPGIGPYTAAAIAAIAYDHAATVVDGNVERVVSRIFAVTDPMPGSKPELKRLAATLTPERRPGDYAQAMMDLGATICTPKSPKCLTCPVISHCQAQQQGIQADLPARTPKAEKPTRRGIAFWLLDAEGRLLLRRRPEKGLLGGMMEIPSTDWATGRFPAVSKSRHAAPIDADWRLTDGLTRHTFTHFHLELKLVRASLPDNPPPPEDCRWVDLSDLGNHALPSLMMKLVRHALADA